MDGRQKTAAQEWDENWTVVLASFLGVTWMAAPAVSLTLFMEPLQHAFGWSRTDISFGMTIYSWVGTPLVPLAGAMVDRFGSRRVALPGLVLNGMAFAAFGLLTPSLWHWWAVWVFYTLTQLFIRSILWNRAVSASFSVSRGLALGITMAGIAAAQTIMPILAEGLIGSYGWRHAYIVLGIAWPGLVLVVALFFLREPASMRLAKMPKPVEAADEPAQGGMTLRQALRDQRILRIVFAIVLQTTIFSGFTLHIFPLLIGSGISRTVAASMVATIGLAVLAGQLASGWLADRVRSWILPVGCFILPGLAYLVVLQGRGIESWLWLGVLLVGFGTGSVINISTYLTTRYGGVLHFGKIYGLISGGMGLGAGIGPYVAGRIFDSTGSYHGYLLLGIVTAVVTTLAVFRLGPYPNYEASPAGREHD